MCAVLYCIHILWLVVVLLYPPVVVGCGSTILLRDASLAPIVLPKWVRCVALRLLHLLCFGLYDAVAVSVGAVVERLFRGHRCRDEIQGAADDAIKTVMNFRKLQLGACMSLQVLQ